MKASAVSIQTKERERKRVEELSKIIYDKCNTASARWQSQLFKRKDHLKCQAGRVEMRILMKKTTVEDILMKPTASTISFTVDTGFYQPNLRPPKRVKELWNVSIL